MTTKGKKHETWADIPQAEREEVASFLVHRVRQYEGMKDYSLIYSRFTLAAEHLLKAKMTKRAYVIARRDPPR